MDKTMQTLSQMGARALPENNDWHHRFSIKSSSNPNREYIVAQRKSSGEWGCSCPAHTFQRGERHGCKHLRSLGLAQ